MYVSVRKWFSWKSFSQVSWHSSLSLPFLFLHRFIIIIIMYKKDKKMFLKSFTQSLYHFFLVLTWILMGVLKYGAKVKGESNILFYVSGWILFVFFWRTKFYEWILNLKTWFLPKFVMNRKVKNLNESFLIKCFIDLIHKASPVFLEQISQKKKRQLTL